MRTPETVTGAREPRAARFAEAAHQAAQRGTGPELPAIKDNSKVVLKFNSSGYKLQLTAPTDQLMADGRQVSGGRALRVDAQPIGRNEDGTTYGVAILDRKKNAMEIDLIFGNEEKGIAPHSYLNVHFWDLKVEVEKQKKDRAAKAVEFLLNNEDALKNEETRLAIIGALQATGDDDFEIRFKEAPKQDQ